MNEIDTVHYRQYGDRMEPMNEQNKSFVFLSSVNDHYRKAEFEIIKDAHQKIEYIRNGQRDEQTTCGNFA